MQNSYLKLHHETKHPVLKGLEDAPRIVNGAARLEVKPIAKFNSNPVTLIPSYPDLPMEKVFPRVLDTNDSQLYLREFGKGRVAYIPWDLDRTFWEVLALDHAKLMRNIVQWATNEPSFVEVEGPGMLDVTVWQQEATLTIHLVNLTNPMTMKGPYRELIPAPEQRVTLNLGPGHEAKSIKLLALDRKPSMRRNGNSLHLTVPQVLDHEIIAIPLKPTYL